MLGLVIPLVLARSSAADPGALRLSEVLADVGARAPALLADRARAEASRRGADASGWWDEPYLAVGPDELPLGDDAPPMLRWQVSQRVPMPGKLHARVTAAAARAAAQETAVEVTARSLRVAATQLFMRALLLEEAARSNAALAEVLEDAKASAAARYITGGTAHHDALLADVELAVLRRDARALARSRRVTFIQLDALRGRDHDAWEVDAPGHKGRVAARFPGLVDDVTVAVPSSLEAALARQPELARVIEAAAAARSDARALELARLPDVTIQLMAMQSFMDEEPSTLGAMVGVALPLFLPWKQDAAADGSARAARAAQLEVDSLLLGLRAEWGAAQEELVSAADTVRLYEEQILPATRLAREASETAYANQQAPLVELLAVARAEAQARLEAVAARLDVRLAQLRLEHLVSQPSVLRLAPQSPTLFGAMSGPASMTGSMGGMAGTSSMGGMPGSTPIHMGNGMTPGLMGVGGDDMSSGGMGDGMGGM